MFLELVFLAIIYMMFFASKQCVEDIIFTAFTGFMLFLVLDWLFPKIQNILKNTTSWRKIVITGRDGNGLPVTVYKNHSEPVVKKELPKKEHTKTREVDSDNIKIPVTIGSLPKNLKEELIKHTDIKK